MASILERYTWLTGRASLPPMWALGYQQCRWHAYSQDDVERIAKRYRDDEFPCDGMWLDIDYMDGYRVFTWDSDRFPDPARMLKGLANQGFRTVSIVDPGVKHDPGYEVYDDGLAQDVFCRTEGGDTYIGQVWPGNTVFPDFATPEARSWWGALNARHVESGLAGIWNDMNEPATGEIAPEAMLFDRGRAKHERFHNQYALLMAMGTIEGLRAARPEARTFILSRAGFAGYPALCRELDGRQPGPLGPPVGQHADGVRLRPVGPALRRRRHRRLPGQHEPGALPALDADGHADSLLPQPLRDRRHRAVSVVVRPRDPRPRP